MVVRFRRGLDADVKGKWGGFPVFWPEHKDGWLTMKIIFPSVVQ